MSEDQPSRVLLACLYDTLSIPVSNQLLYELFSASGCVRKVLIFQRGDLTKCFVEMLTKQEAVKVMQLLNGTKVFESRCKLHLYFSPLEEVDLKNRFSKGKDFSSTEQSSEAEREHRALDELLEAPGAWPSEFKKYKTADQYYLQQVINTIRYEQPSKSLVEIPTPQNSHPLPSWYYTEQLSEPYWMQVPAVPTCIVSLRYEDHLTLTEVYNLFSNFGNIEKIVRKSTLTYVQFTNYEFAVAAKQHLSGLKLFGTVMTVEEASTDDIQEKPREYTESIIYDPSHDRFNLSKTVSINAPSIVLHVSNLKKETCTEAKVRRLFEQHGKVEKVQLLLNIKDKFMALVRFSELEESLNATTALHNRDIAGRRVHISFTKSKI